MMKLFVYNINGTIIEDTEAFGKGWATAKEIAKKEHCGITRQVIYNNTIKNEFFAIGGAFLNERFFEDKKLYIF